MTPEQIIKYYDGSTSFAAYNLGYSESAIRNWLKSGQVPFKAQRLIQAITAGKLQAKEVDK